jgi:hypothetical protein
MLSLVNEPLAPIEATSSLYVLSLLNFENILRPLPAATSGRIA